MKDTKKDKSYYPHANRLGITPGPWKVYKNSSKYNRLPTCIRSDYIPNVIADFHGLQHMNREENARLIAAAPDLYEALINLKNEQCFCSVGIGNPMYQGKHSENCINAQKAINKARGTLK